MARRRPRTRGPQDLATPESVEARLTREILELDQANKTRVGRDVVEIGQRLLDLQQHLGFGAWLSWLSKHLPYSPRTAQRYIAIAQWSAAHPEDFEHFVHLGLGKLQLLAALSPHARARFRRFQTFRIPGTDTRRTLALMTHEQLERLIKGPGGFRAVPPAVPPSKMLRRFRHRVAGLDALADQLRANADAFDSDEIEDTIDALEAVTNELRTMLPS